jgi:hypothetical protein
MTTLRTLIERWLILAGLISFWVFVFMWIGGW